MSILYCFSALRLCGSHIKHSTTISSAWVRQADQAYQRVIHQETDVNTEQGIDEQ